MKLAQKAKYKGDGYWDWAVWLEGSKATLAKVVKVRYLLHPTFDPPTRWSEDRRTKFRLESSGWGEFRIRADVFLADREVVRLTHDLKLVQTPRPSARKAKGRRPSSKSVAAQTSVPIEETNWLAVRNVAGMLEGGLGSSATATGPHITFIHGICNKPSSDSLLRSWLSFLADSSGIDLIAEGVTVSMVYWADVLYAEVLTEAIEEGLVPANRDQPRTSPAWLSELSRDERYFVAALEADFEKAANRADDEMKAEAVPMEERIWLPWFVKEPLMDRLLRDVHHYLFNVEHSPREGVTYRVQDEIRRRFVEALKLVGGRPHVVVSHSMGTVVAYDCLKRVRGCPAIDALMTIGSPLGLDEIQDKLSPEWTREDGFPQSILGSWVNIYDRFDPVCGFDPNLSNDFCRNGRQVVEDVNEQNSGRWRHCIDHYLRGPRLRNELRRLLQAAPAPVVEPEIRQSGAHSLLIGLPSVTAGMVRVQSARPSGDLTDTALPNASGSSPGNALEDPSRSPVIAPQSHVQFLAQLEGALATFDYTQVADLRQLLVSDLRAGKAPPDAKQSASILGQLRKHRRFKEMRLVADALLAAGQSTPRVRKLYAQALIDDGDIAAGLMMASQLADDPSAASERSEARGLMGRAYKQWFVQTGDWSWLDKAIDAYLETYVKDPNLYTWHGINVVALATRAEQRCPEGQSGPTGTLNAGPPPPVDSQKMASEILARVADKEQAGVAEAWDFAIALEACLALALPDDAIAWARKYVHSKEVDAFAIAGTLRQLREIWQLTQEQSPGNLLLPLLEAELLAREGGEVILPPGSHRSAETTRLDRAGRLEKVFGRDSYVTWGWYQLGVTRCRSVARVETQTGQGIGTGFLVNARDLLGPAARGTVFLTNSHVLAADGLDGSLAPNQAYVWFESFDVTRQRRLRIEEILASSPPGELDFTVARLSASPDNLYPVTVSEVVPNPAFRQRLYAIGHPNGAGLAFSIHDNLLIDFRSPFLQYRTPTDPGSSGSAIFDDQWNLIALHHAGDRQMPRLNGKGVHEANEGIWITAIREHLMARAQAPPPPRIRSTSTRHFQSTARPSGFPTRNTTMKTTLQEKESLLRQYAAKIADVDRWEGLKTEAPVMAARAESLGPALPEPTPEEVVRAIEKVQIDTPLDESEMAALEAIVLPRERPVVFIDDDSYSVPESPWEHFDNTDIRSRLQAAIPFIGRVELPDNPQIPFGGTAFVVGPNLLMTNRHVAELFATGLGQTVTFRSGQSVGWDRLRERHSPGAAMLEVKRILMIHPYWDMALLEVAGLDTSQGSLRLAAVPPEELAGKEVAVIGYPARDWRNDLDLQDRIFQRTYNVKRLQPGKIVSRETIRSFENRVPAMTHDSSTLGGNSGSAIVDVGTGEVVGLHFAGVYLKANYAVPTYELAGDRRVAGLNVRFTGRAPENPEVEASWRRLGGQPTRGVAVGGTERGRPTTGTAVRLQLGSSAVSVPLQISLVMDGQALPSEAISSERSLALEFLEATKTPVIFPHLDQRRGYDPAFLQLDGDREVPLPKLTSAGESIAARLDDESFELKYHKFSIVMHKKRRFALFTASNVDWRERMRKINGRKPSRDELNGFTPNDRELWTTDERIPENQQLPDRFFTKDGGFFDRGHIIRRDDVCWGTTFKDMQKSNGDTFHTTNCTPQVAGFNQATQGEDNWGDLENMIQKQTDAERVIVFAGPVLDDDNDLRFEGVDSRGEVLIQIPSRYWKVVVAKGDTGPEAYGFLLEQDLTDVPLEISVPARWRRFMQSIEEIEKLLFGKATLDGLKSHDQFESPRGRRMRERVRR